MSQLLTLKEVERRVCLKRSSIYRAMRATPRGFPLPIKIGPKTVRWIAGEIEDWLASRPRATGDLGRHARTKSGIGRPPGLGRAVADGGGRRPIESEQESRPNRRSSRISAGSPQAG